MKLYIGKAMASLSILGAMGQRCGLGFLLSVCSLTICFILMAQADEPLSPVERLMFPKNKPNQLVRFESELPIRYFPDKKEWATQEGKGNIKLVYQELTLFTKRARYDENNQILEATEGVKAILQQGVEFEGQKATYQVNERRWWMEGGKALIEPSYFREGVVAPVYFKAQKLSGDERRTNVKQTIFSSCDRLHPHYSLQADEVDVIPEDRLILRHVGVYLGDTKLLGLGRYSISLRPRRQRYRLPFTPDVGRDRINGMFIRLSVDVMDTRSQTSNLLLDWSEKRGSGFGIEHNYKFRLLHGNLNFFSQRSPLLGSEQILSWQHKHILASGLIFTIFSEDRRNTPYFFSQRFSNSSRQISIRKNWMRGTSELSWRSFGYKGSTQSSDRTWTFSHSFVSSRQSLSLLATVREFLRTGQPNDQELNEKLEMRSSLSDQWDASLRFEQRVDLDRDRFTNDSFFFALDKIPELTFNFRPKRSSFFLPVMTLNLARWREQPESFSTERAQVRLDTPQTSIRISGGLELKHKATFEQFLYGNDTAQYLYKYRGALSWRWGGKNLMELSYWLQKHKGFTPFRYDAISTYENLDLQVNFIPSEKFLLSMTTGLDVQRDFFRDALINLRWRPNQGTSLALSTGYSIEQSNWRDILGRLVLIKPSGLGLPTFGTFVNYHSLRPSPFADERPAPPPGGFRSELSFRYSPDRKRWTRLRLFLDWRVSKIWRLESLIGYSGISRKLDIVQFRITRDFHCYQAWVTYNRERREFRFFFTIKAFPLLQQFFGTSNQGAFLDTSVGQDY